MDTRPRLQKTDWAYLAGFIDGEGCIAARTRNRLHLPIRVQIHITQKYGGILIRLRDLFDVGTTYTVNNKGGHTQTRWSITKNQDVMYLLGGVIPYLKLKTPQAKLCMVALVNDLDSDAKVELERRVSYLKTVDPYPREVV